MHQLLVKVCLVCNMMGLKAYQGVEKIHLAWFVMAVLQHSFVRDLRYR